MDLESHLLKPMQRVTKMPLLIRQIIRFTPPDHPDMPALVAAQQTMDAVVDGINTQCGVVAEETRLVALRATVAADLSDVRKNTF